MRRAQALWPYALIALIALGCTFAPQASEPGYEYGLLAGLALPWLAGALSARASFLGGTDMLLPSLRRAVGYGAVSLTVVWLRTVGAEPCDFVGGTWWVASGAALGVACASLLGSLLGTGASSPARAFARGAWPPLLSLLLGLLRFWSTPSVHAYDTFAGYFAGTLYDTVIPFDARYAWSRALPIALAAAVAVAPRRWRMRVLALWVVFVSIEPQFGWLHHNSVALAGRLSQTRGGECTVYAEPSIPSFRVDALLKQCEVDKRDVEAYFGVSSVPVTMFLFQDAAQKQRLMGAGHTYIAKPWRHEIYVQDAGFPHPTLRHEVAHVVSSAFAAGPFRVAGAWGGWLPDPGRIEGFAVAAEGDGARRALQVADMRNAGVLPTWSQVFSLGFLNAPGARSYAYAGAVVDHIRARFGASVLRRWYAGESLESLTHEPQASLESAFVRSLPAGALERRAEAKARYGGPGILARRCPHRIDMLREQASECVARGEAERARELLASAMLLAPGDPVLRFEDARVARPDDAEAMGVLQRLAGDEGTEPVLRSAVLELIADRARDGGAGLEVARLHYQQAAELVSSEDRHRLLELKVLALSEHAPAALRKRFSRTKNERTAPGSSAPDDAWARYFSLKDALNAGDLRHVTSLEDALHARVSELTPLAQEEARRMAQLVQRYASP